MKNKIMMTMLLTAARRAPSRQNLQRQRKPLRKERPLHLSRKKLPQSKRVRMKERLP